MFTLIKIFWKVYFFFIFFVFIKLSFPLPSSFNIIEILDIAMIIPSLAGLFGFAFKYTFLKKSIWKLYFITLVTWDFFYHFIIDSFFVSNPLSLELIVFLIALAPLYIGLFIYSFLISETH